MANRVTPKPIRRSLFVAVITAGTLIVSLAGAVNAHSETNGVTDVDVDYGAFCATKDGGAWCWGENDAGRVGNGWVGDWPTPTRVQDIASGTTAIATSLYNSCAVRSGAVDCWGRGLFGMLGFELGYGQSVNPYSSPMPGLASGVTEIALTYAHGCAIVPSGVKCWGRNNDGELGNGSTSTTPTTDPVSVSGIGPSDIVSEVDVFGSESCAIVNAAVKCWGSGHFGSSLTPTTLVGLDADVTDLDVGQSASCAVKSGTVYCWGQRLLDYSGSQPAPAAVTELGTGASKVSVGYLNGCAVFSGAVKCWGRGALGDGARTEEATVVSPSTLAAGVTDVDVGMGVACALGSVLKCWGIAEFSDDWEWSDELSLTPQTIDFDLSAPTASVGGPTQVTTDDVIDFELNSTEDGWFECALNGQPVDCLDGFSRSFDPGTVATNTLEVVAFDWAGNESEPVTHTFDVNVPFPPLPVGPDLSVPRAPGPAPISPRREVVAGLAVKKPTKRHPRRFVVTLVLSAKDGLPLLPRECGSSARVRASNKRVRIDKRIRPVWNAGRCVGKLTINAPKRAARTKIRISVKFGGAAFTSPYLATGSVRTR